MTFNDCKNAGSCGKTLCFPEFCHEFDPIQKTNADRIRAMSDEELASFLEQTQADVAFSKKSKYAFEWEKWLQQPADK